ncbi:TonB-dependent receptor [Nibrella saemangeumensis]|uniref:TonB-dependent receptor n=1 Tax=Nibrella saemangeumensis TaxID=1084526 RepID=A0ABP8NQN9_9BACT
MSISFTKKEIFNLMKITTIHLLLISCLASFSVAGPTLGQDRLQERISLHVKNTDLRTVLRDIEKKADVTFSYQKGVIAPNDKISLEATDETLERVLQQLFTSRQIRYQVIRSNKIVLTRPNYTGQLQETTEQLPDGQAIGQSRQVSVDQTIRGRVTDETNAVLPGVSVVLKGTQRGTTTNTDGRFELSVPETGAPVLVFSFVGYKTQEVSVGTQTTLQVSLAPENKALSEVVVVGYGTQNRRDIAGAVSSIDAQKIADQPLTGFDQALQGQAAGVQVNQTSGTPGGGVTVRIRGASSINASSDPLYVIDGVPITNNGALAGSLPTVQPINPLSTINPNDIESIEILKDASATAIYGSRGANGVVLVTTKSGRDGRNTMSYNTYYGFSKIRKQIPMLNAGEFSAFVIESNENGWLDRGNNPNVANASRGAWRNSDLVLDPNHPLRANTNWQDEIFRTAAIKNHQLSFNGGTSKLQYLISANYFDQEGVIIESGFKRYSFRGNIDAQVTDKIKAGIRFNPSYSYNQLVDNDGHFVRGGLVNSALLAAPLYPVYDANGNYVSQTALSTNSTGIGLGNIDNPVALARESSFEVGHLRLLGNMYVEAELLNGLRVRTSFGGDINAFRNREFRGSKLANGGSPPPSVPSGASRSSQDINWLNENILTYDRSFGNHKINTTLGYTVQKSDYELNAVGAINYPNDLVEYVAAGQVTSGTAQREQWALESYLGRINYSFNSKYLVTASFRRDGSSRFGTGNKYGNFPSLALGWRVSEERFMRDLDGISNLKIRGSYGLTGNFNIGNYSSIGQLSPVRYVLGTAANLANGQFISTPNNQDLTWETTYQANAGIDIGFFQGRLELSADIYKKKTKDLLLAIDVPHYSGFGSALTNIGEVENKGIELAINSVNTTGALKWNTSFNISGNRNKVVDLGPIERRFVSTDLGGTTAVLVEGQPFSQFWGLRSPGIFKSTEEANAYVNASGTKIQPNASGGDVKYIDVNGDGKIDSEDMTFIGNPNPTFIFGLGNNLSWKNFSLNVLLSGSYGNDILNMTRRILIGGSSNFNVTRDYWQNRWTPENPNATEPRAIRGDRNGNTSTSTRIVEDGSYLRLRNIVLAYNLPKPLISRVKLANARVYFSGANVLTFTKYKGFDPEVNEYGNSAISQGIDSGGYPLPATYTFGIDLTF